MRAILHVDMDAFYASVEQYDRPELRGRPVIVGFPAQRSVVLTASYEARPFGVRSAMPSTQAQRLCPHAIWVAPRMARYREVSARVFEVFAEVTPVIEGLSLDEAFLDVTASLRLFGGIEPIGRKLKADIRTRTGLAASIGTAHNKLLAKLASELGKPDGLLHIMPDRVRTVLDPLPVGRLWTVGRQAQAALQGIGIRTIGDLRRADPGRLGRALGRDATRLQALARGEDERPVEPDAKEKSIGSETTFAQDLETFEQAAAWLLRLCEKVAARTRRAGLRGRVVHLKLREPPFLTHSRQATLPAPTDATAEINLVARDLLESWWQIGGGRRLRLLGVSLGGFETTAQQDLFARDADVADSVQDRINARFGEGSLVRGRALPGPKAG
ncbi:MAG TPA: DNA polymerase IV [Rhodanobacteraceae bacterium]|nr:DNA polymerase IV [Rhodanobacteraceae bacterium]